MANWSYSFIAPADYNGGEWNAGEWSAGEWSACSAVCGHGIQTRVVACRQDGHITSDQNCIAATKPNANKTCQEEQCSNYRWTVGDWSEVSSA